MNGPSITNFGVGGGGATAAPVVTGVTTDTGASSTDGITTDRRLLINGTAAAGSTVEVFKDDVSIGTTTANGSGVWQYDYTGTELGANNTYEFTATAYIPSSESAAFTVVTDTTVPTAAITYSPAGPYATGTSVTITATASKAIDSANGIKLALSGADTLAATAMTRVSSTVYTYAYTSGSGNGTTTVTLSNAKDIAGNSITGTPTSGATFTLGTNPFAGLASNNWQEQASSARIYDRGIIGDPAVSDGSGGTAASPLTAGQWTTVKYSGGTNSNKQMLLAWCGGAWDEALKCVWLFGTGHSDGRDNSLVQYFPATEAYVRVLWPDHAPWTSATDPTNTQTTNPDGGPIARHTANSMCVYNGYLYVSGYAAGDNAASPARLWRFPTNGTLHSQWELAPTTGIDASEQTSFTNVFADANSGLICCVNNQVFTTINPANFSAGFTERLDNTFTAYWNWNGEQYMSGAIDVSRSKLFIVGRNQSSVFSISNLASITVNNSTSWTGDYADLIAIGSSYMGVTYDSVDQLVVVWKGGSDHYTVNMSTLAITKVASSGGSVPSAMTANGVYSRFCHSASWDTFICINDENACDYLKG